MSFSSKSQLNPLQQLQPYVCDKNDKIALGYIQAFIAYYAWSFNVVYSVMLDFYKKENPDRIVND